MLPPWNTLKEKMQGVQKSTVSAKLYHVLGGRSIILTSLATRFSHFSSFRRDDLRMIVRLLCGNAYQLQGSVP